MRFHVSIIGAKCWIIFMLHYKIGHNSNQSDKSLVQVSNYFLETFDTQIDQFS